MSHRLLKLSVAALATSLLGCTQVEYREKIDAQAVVQRQAIVQPVRQADEPSRVVEVRKPFVPASVLPSPQAGAWLRAKRVSLDVVEGTRLSAVARQLSNQGVNIVSDLPMDNVYFVGKINNTDAETALRIVMGGVGYDFEVNDTRQLVVVRPVSSKTWYLNIGNRRTSYSTNGSASLGSSSGNVSGLNSSSSNSSGSSSGTSTSGTSTTGTGSTTSGTSSSLSSGSSGTSGSFGTGVSSSDEFWTSLDREMQSRLTVFVANNSVSPSQQSMMPSLPMPVGNSPAGLPIPTVIPAAQNIIQPIAPSNQNGQKRQIGSYALNPETGSITVQAPSWILRDLDDYILRIQDMYNTNVTLSGEIVMVRTQDKRSEGLDLSSFGRWANSRFGAIVSNNPLGGVTMSFANGSLIPSVSAGSQQVGGGLLGITSAKDGLQIFNAYLQEIGNVSVIQKPVVTTTSGVPGEFRRMEDDYYNTISQSVAAGNTGSATTGTANTIVKVTTGTELHVNPRMDVSTGLIRAQINMRQILRSGTRNLAQVVTTNGSSMTVPTGVPLLTEMSSSGEILLRDGDVIIAGGHTEDEMTVYANGLPGGKDPIGGIFGQSRTGKGQITYFFALRVIINKR